MFTAEEREIYEFHNGERMRKVDPLALRRALVRAAQGDLAGLSQQAAEPKREEGAPPEEAGPRLLRLEAQEKMVEVIRAGFGLPPFDAETGQGATESMCWKVWHDYCEWLEGNGKKGAAGPGPSPSQAGPAPPTT